MNDLITLLRNFELTGNSLLIEDLEIAPQEEKTESGILLTDKVDNSIALKKALVLKAGRGYINYQGIFIKNPIEEGAEIYYKNAGEYILEGIKFKGTEGGQVVAYKNMYTDIGQPIGSDLTD